MTLMRQIRVVATPFGEAEWAVECSECDFKTLTGSAAVDHVSRDHLNTHKDQ